MINLETPQFSIVVGVDELKCQAPKQAIVAAFVVESYPLSDDEAVTRFTMLNPADATVDNVLRERLSKMPSTVDALGLRMALIRWSDGTESLVGFAIDETVPPPALLKSAYRSGYGVSRLKVSLAKRAEGNGHG